MAASQITPPPGFVLEDQKQGGATPPPGFVLEGEQPGLFSRIGTGVREGFGIPEHPISQLSNEIKHIATSPGESAKQIAAAPIQGIASGAEKEIGRAKDAFSQFHIASPSTYGHGLDAAAHGLYSLIPGGSTLGDAGEKINSGDVAGGLAEAGAFAAPAVLGNPEVRGKIGQTISAVAKPAGKAIAGAALDTPIVGGALRGLKAVKDVPGEVASVWRKPAPFSASGLPPDVTVPEETASPEIQPAPYRVSGSKLTDPETVTPRQVLPASRQLKAAPEPFTPTPEAKPSPYRISGPDVIDGTTITPRQILGPERQLMAPAEAGQNPVPLEVAPQVKAKPQIAGPSKPQLPNATFLRDDIRSQTQQPPVTPRPERLLQSLREWDLTRRVNDEMNAQIGSPEEENVQAFIKAHDWKGAGAKPSIAGPKAAPPAAKFNDPAPLPEALQVAGPSKPAINVRPDPSARQPLTQRGTVPQGQTARTLGREGEYALQETKNTPPVEIGSTEWTPERMQQQIDAIKAQKARAARSGK